MQRNSFESDSLQHATEYFYTNDLGRELSFVLELARLPDFDPCGYTKQHAECEAVNQLLVKTYWTLADIPEYQRLEAWFATHILHLGRPAGLEYLVQAASNALWIMQEFSQDFPQKESIEEAGLPSRLLALYKYRKPDRPSWEARRLIALSAVLELTPAELCLSIDDELSGEARKEFFSKRWGSGVVLPWAVALLHTQALSLDLIAEYDAHLHELKKPAT